MKKTPALPILVFLALAFFLPACQQPEMDDSIDPHEQYFDNMVHDGDQNVSIKKAITYYVGEKIDPASLDNSSLYLREQAGSTVRGSVDGFQFTDCVTSPLGCPLGVSFLSGGGPICDLTPNTVYELVIDNLVLDDGSTLSKTITFTTGNAPPGYVPSPCPYIVSGNSLDPAQGISGSLTGESHDLDLTAIGIETGAPYNDYKNLTNPRYITILKIKPISGNYDLSTTVKWLNIRINGTDIQVSLPDTNIPVNNSLVLYVAQNGSTYFALTPDRTYDLSSGNCDSAGSGCPSYTPDLAYTPTNLAGGTSSDITPLKFLKDAVDVNFGLNGGVLNNVPMPIVVFSLYGIQGNYPYYGWDQLANPDQFQVGSHDSMSYNEETPLYHREFSPFMVGHILTGSAYEPVSNLISTPDSWLLLLIENLDSTAFSLTPYPTVDVTDDGAVTSVSLPADSIPPGESLPLYVDRDGSSYYAFESGGFHTLDLVSNLCDGSTACPTMDPITSMTGHPAAP